MIACRVCMGRASTTATPTAGGGAARVPACAAGHHTPRGAEVSWGLCAALTALGRAAHDTRVLYVKPLAWGAAP